ncbi:hypothetical protein F4775DRAFT_562222 [Biscogniauxia sp. FL1348]|nr:hypothetical protein F4775DRAFT_562222 [Biscogniauxia sp. FL1348]
MRFSLSLLAVLAPLALAQGPCAMPDCLPVMDASACYNAIILGWEGASQDPADIFKCVDDPALMCACYGCTTGLDELVTDNELCPLPEGRERERVRMM